MKKVILLIIGLVLISGCVTNPLLKPSKSITTTVFPEYRKLIIEKYNKPEDKEKLERRLRTLKNYECLLETYETR